MVITLQFYRFFVIWMELAMQIISNDKIARTITVQIPKSFNSQFLTIQVIKGEQLVSTMPANKKVFDKLRDDIVDISAENESLKFRISFFDAKWWVESRAKHLKQFMDEKRANL